MKTESEKNYCEPWDCFSFPCADSCCQYGVDVYPDERDMLIAEGMATASDFSGPAADEDGLPMYRTKQGSRGCIFLHNERGCKLHVSGHKPSVCRVWPRTFQEAKSAAGKGYLPCFALQYKKEPINKRKAR